jgi:hypothetical protein
MDGYFPGSGDSNFTKSTRLQKQITGDYLTTSGTVIPAHIGVVFAATIMTHDMIFATRAQGHHFCH